MTDLMCGDCLELMRKIPDGAVDLILTDLPYGVTRCSWDLPIPFAPMWDQFHRITKPNAAIVLHCMEPFSARLVSSNLKDYKYKWVWHKNVPTGFLNAKKQPLRNVEDIAVFYRKQCTYHPQMTPGKIHTRQGGSAKRRDGYGKFGRYPTQSDSYYPTQILSFKAVPTPDRSHASQKPVQLLEYLIRTYTNPGETVLDCCMGSGSTGVAAVNTDREFIGIELDKSFFDIACARIGAAIEAKDRREAV